MASPLFKIREISPDGKSFTVATARGAYDVAALVVMAPKHRSVVYLGRVVWSAAKDAPLLHSDLSRAQLEARVHHFVTKRVAEYWAARSAAAGLR